MNEETGRAEGGGVTREKKEGKKRYDCRWGHIRANREETECESGGEGGGGTGCSSNSSSSNGGGDGGGSGIYYSAE